MTNTIDEIRAQAADEALPLLRKFLALVRDRYEQLRSTASTVGLAEIERWAADTVADLDSLDPADLAGYIPEATTALLAANKHLDEFLAKARARVASGATP